MFPSLLEATVPVGISELKSAKFGTYKIILLPLFVFGKLLSKQIISLEEN